TKLDSSQLWTEVNSASRSKAASSKEPVIDPLASQYSKLGATPDLSDESLLKVHEANMKCWPENSPNFFEALSKIANARGSETLSTKIAFERSKGIISRSEIENAYTELRLKPKRIPTEDDLAAAVSKRLEDVTHPERRKVLKDAIKTIAEHRNSDMLRTLLITSDDSQDQGGVGMLGIEAEKMDPAKAYRALEIEKEVDDETLVMVYDVRVTDAKDDAEKNKMHAALTAIAEDRNSDRLRAAVQTKLPLDCMSQPSISARSHLTSRLFIACLASTGRWQVAPRVDPTVPVGLTNIANTCYLNSLLQYFFTVRELREAVLAFSTNGNETVTDQIRVGGRLVTKAEIERSRRFVLLLQTLFQNLIHSNVPAVSPETELAYLALVPSKEEENGIATEKKNTSTEDDDDLIILEPAENEKAQEPVKVDNKSTTVLGKRRTEEKEEGESTSIEQSTPSDAASSTLQSSDSMVDRAPVATDAEMTVASPRPSLARASSSTLADNDERIAKRGRSVDQLVSEDATLVDVSETSTEPSHTSPRPESEVVAPPVAPALPPRPAPPARQQTKDEKLEAQVSSYMAYGRQNDVTECMDNVMFQIETAFKANATNVDDTLIESLPKRIFYGKNRQKLSFDGPSTTSEPIRKQEEPFFSLLVDVPPTSFDRDIYDGLDAVFDDTLVEIEGKSARRTISLLQLPPVLHIQLQRVQYDREKGRIFKSNAHLRFPEELNLARYLERDDTDPVILKKKASATAIRQQLEAAKTKLAHLEQATQRFKDTLDKFGTISDELDGLLNPELAEDIALEAQALENDIVVLRKRIDLLRKKAGEIWEYSPEHDYELRAVFIHRGTASSGHYFIYQRDSSDPKRWLKYNDSVISTVDRAEIYRETMSDTNAYFLVYCRKDRLDAIETIKRILD
ncbi:ubiquitin-specific protease UBP2, partial [Sporobolomyces salmoneus]|uniref:ubiquitin-specific protease UBP2 n=1 Tax=Sporobolomyces salmoneus TaxID=183962 RepID=UPI00317D709D